MSNLPAIKTRPIEVPALPPMPVFDEHIDTYLAKSENLIVCDQQSFEAAKALATEGVRLKQDVTTSFAPVTQAIDALKAPVLESRNGYIERIDKRVELIDASANSWKKEQDRIAQEEANKRQQEELKRREEARQAKIKEEEEKRQAEIKRRQEEREAEQKRLDEQALRQAETNAEWGEPAVIQPVELPPIEEPPPVHVPEVIPPRPVQADSGLSYRRGGSKKPTYKFEITDPDKVLRAFCSPDQQLINVKVKAYFKLIKEPTAEQISALEEEIGGGKIYLD